MDKRASALLDALERAYPEARCSLHFKNPYELWAATVLSAQCTDARVNQVTPALFERCPTPADLAQLPQEELQGLVRPTGFFRNKAKSLKAGAQLLMERFGGQVPQTLEELLQVPGVARKTANVVLSNGFGKAEGIAVDTHVRRVAGRLGFTGHRDPVRIERDLMALFPQPRWPQVTHLLIHHGRAVCQARKPRCETCPVAKRCPKVGV